MNFNSFPRLYHIISILKTSLESYENDIDGDTNGKKGRNRWNARKNQGIVGRGKMESWAEDSMQMQCNWMLICRGTKGLVFPSVIRRMCLRAVGLDDVVTRFRMLDVRFCNFVGFFMQNTVALYICM